MCGKKFPKSTVKNRSDITLGNEIGEGAFGKVYKGFLHLSKHERYVLFDVIYESNIKVIQLLMIAMGTPCAISSDLFPQVIKSKHYHSKKYCTP